MSARLLTSAIALVLVLAGCSQDEEPAPGPTPTPSVTTTTPAPAPAADDPKALLARIDQQVAQAKSVRVRAKIDMDGEKVDLDIQMNRAGRAKGKITTGADGSITVILIGRKGWMLPGKTMLKQITGGDPAVEKYVAGKWIPFGPDDADLGQFIELMNIETFFADLITDADLRSDDLVRVKGKKFGGRQTFGLKKPGETGTLFVASGKSAELVAYRDPDGTLQFSDWDQKFKATKPAKVFSKDELA